MITTKSILNSALIITIFFGLGAFAGSVHAQPLPPPLISQVDLENNKQTIADHQDLGTKRSRNVLIQKSSLDQIAVSLSTRPDITQQAEFQVFEGLSFLATFTKQENTIQGGYLLSGILNGSSEDSITVVSTEGVISAILTVDGIQYQLKSNQVNQYRFDEIDQSQFPSEAESIPLPDLQPDASNLDDTPEVALDSSALIDVMVVFTDDARAAAGNIANMNNLINLAISETNTGYSQSGILQRMRLVHTAEVNFNESGLNWVTALNQLTNADGVIDQVLTWRNTYAADLVVMIVNDEYYCGIGWLMKPSYTYDSVGFSLVSRTCATGYYSFGHEAGHNMGAHHDRANASESGMYSYSYGYAAPNSSFRTIMAYPSSCGGCTRINRWSNPDLTFNGIPTGVISTASNSADNRLTLNNTANIVANFRQSNTIPIAPSNLGVTAVTTTSINLSFIDNSSNESGFKLERTSNSVNWLQVATLAANQSTYVDQNLSCGTSYAYRVKAYNSIGESAFSNTINTATSLCTPPALPDAITTFSSIDSVTLRWNDVPDETAYMIEQSLDEAKSWTDLVTLEQNTTSYQITGLERNTTYTFRLVIHNDIGDVYSDPIIVKTMSEAIYLPSIRR